MDVDTKLSDLEELAKLKIAQRAQVDLFYLVSEILAPPKSAITERTHGELCRYTSSLLPREVPTDLVPPEKLSNAEMGDQFDHRKNFLMLLMPRNSLKSSIVTIGFSLQMLLNDPNVRILIDSETYAKAKAFLAEIKGHLEHNYRYRELFKTIHGVYPDAKKKSELWTTEMLNVACRTQWRKEPTISCAGVDVTKTGMHYDLIIMDDLHSEKNVTTKEQIDQVKDHYKLGLSLLEPGKPLVIIGTRWDYNDLYQHILDYERDRFNIIIRKAKNEDGSLFFPEILTEKFLEDQKKSQGSYIHSCQYYNEPVDDETATFKRSNFRYMEMELVDQIPINWYLSVDPSYEGPYSDYAAFVTAGMDSNAQLYVKDVVRAKMTYADIIKMMFTLWGKFSHKQILLETLATQKSIQHYLISEEKQRGTKLPVTEIHARSKSKEERIRGLAPYYENGRIHHVKECNQLDDLEYELIHFPKGKHDDMIDALAGILEIATPPRATTENSRSYEKRKKLFAILDKPRSPIAGV